MHKSEKQVTYSIQIATLTLRDCRWSLSLGLRGFPPQRRLRAR